MPMTSHLLDVIHPLKVLVEQDDFDKVPNIKLKDNSDFQLLASNMTAQSIVHTPSYDEHGAVSEAFDTIIEYTGDSRNIARLQSVEYAAKGFASIIENSYATINTNIAVTVDDLKSRIEKRYIELMKREKAESLLSEDMVPTEEDYKFLSWNGLTSPTKQNEIIEAACRNANISSASLSALNASYIIRKLSFTDNFENINIQEDIKTTIAEKLAATFNTIPKETVSQFVSMITDKNNYLNHCTSLAYRIADTKNVAINSMFLVQQSDNLENLTQNAHKYLLSDLDDTSNAKLMKNLEALSATIYGTQYWLLLNKNIRFKETLVLTSDTLNKPVYDEFVKNGHTISDIHNYLKAVYAGNTLPMSGISMTTVMSTDIKEKLALSASKLKSQANFIKAKCLIAAYENTMNWFITDLIVVEKYTQAKATSIINKFSNIAKIKASSLGGNLANLDNALYEVILSSFHDNSLVSTMYKYMGKNFKQLTEASTEDISDLDIVKSQCFAVAELLVDYLFDTLVVTKNPYNPVHTVS